MHLYVLKIPGIKGNRTKSRFYVLAVLWNPDTSCWWPDLNQHGCYSEDFKSCVCLFPTQQIKTTQRDWTPDLRRDRAAQRPWYIPGAALQKFSNTGSPVGNRRVLYH